MKVIIDNFDKNEIFYKIGKKWIDDCDDIETQKVIDELNEEFCGEEFQKEYAYSPNSRFKIIEI